MSEEKRFQQIYKAVSGYFLPINPVVISMIAIFAALACVLTMTIQIPVVATGGYINLGDFIVMLSGLLFGPIIGGLAGGIGSCLADIISGYPLYVIPTLIIKGLEGFIVGMISNPRKENKFYIKWRNIQLNLRDIIAVIVGGLIMVFGYFTVEAFILNYGIAAAASEIPGNMFQFGLSVIISLLMITAIRKTITEALPQVFDKIYNIE